MQNKLRKILLSNRGGIELTIVLMESVIIGFYINIVTSEIYSTMPHMSVMQAMVSARWWNAAIAVLLLLLFVQISSAKWLGANMRSSIEDSINKTLEMSVRTLLHPRTIESRHIRAIVTLYNFKSQKRYTAYSFNADPDPERYGANLTRTD